MQEIREECGINIECVHSKQEKLLSQNGVDYKMTQPESQQPQYDYDEIDLRDIFRTLGKWKYKIISFTLICMLLSGIVSWCYLDPVYEASTIVAVNQEQVEQALTGTGNIEDMVNQLGKIPDMTPQSSVQQVTSPGILQATIEKLKLPYTRGGLKGMIKTEQIKDTNLIQITVSNKDPKIATEIANTIREEFLVHVNQVNSQKLERSLDAMKNKWLNQEENDLKNANNSLKEYKLKSRSTEFLTSQLTGKNKDLATCQSKLVQAEIKEDKLKQGIQQEKDNLKNTPATLPIISTADSELPANLSGININNLKISSEKVNDAYLKSSDAYNRKMTDLAETQAEISKTRQQMQELDKEIRVLEAEMINNQIEEKDLKNEVERRETVVKLLNSKIAEVKMTDAMDLAGNNILTVSKAVVPEEPVKPNKVLNVAIAAVLGLMLSVFGVFLIEYLNNEQ